MPELSLSRNAQVLFAATNVAVNVAGALDITFVFANMATFKVQGSVDNVVSYADLAGTGFPASGQGFPSGTTLLAQPAAGICQSLTLTRLVGFNWVKPIFTALGGQTAMCFVIRRYLRQSPVINLDEVNFQRTIISPIAGTI